MNINRINFLFDSIPWFGSHTGYEQLPRYMMEIHAECREFKSKNAFADRVVGKIYSTTRKWPPRNQISAATEWRFARGQSRDSIGHILYGENHLLFLDDQPKMPRSLISTIHLPPSQWDSEMLGNLHHLSSAIILYQRDLEFFESVVGAGQVKFIHYGVDAEFFRPAASDAEPQNILFAGHYLRNTKMLHRVISRLASRHSSLQFDLLVPEARRGADGLSELASHPAVRWHQGLSDEALRDLYAGSRLLLLPMNESGANTAIVEAMACGLPVATTDVGGVRDYGGGTLFPLVDNDDDDAMIELVERYLEDLAWRNSVSRECRAFVEQNLNWPIIAEKHLEIYRELTQIA